MLLMRTHALASNNVPHLGEGSIHGLQMGFHDVRLLLQPHQQLDALSTVHAL